MHYIYHVVVFSYSYCILLMLIDVDIFIFCSMFFFFKQKTAYEMRISDWSSDVCSSDLSEPAEPKVVSASDLRPISTPAPRYPIDALRAGRSGEVQVEFTVAADGSVTSARVVRSNPPRVFDREAVAAVKRWRFEPTGAPVTTRRTIGFTPGG